MSECSAVRESMPLLLTESLDPVRREVTHQHIESCAVCEEEWSDCKTAWAVMGDLPEVEVPSRVREQFLLRAGVASRQTANVVPFQRRAAVRWLAQAAAIVVLAGGGYLAGNRGSAEVPTTPARIDSITPQAQPVAFSIAETRVLDAEALSPEIQGRPKITNIQFADSNPSDNEIGVSFDVTSRWTVTGNPKDRSMVRLMSYMLENEGGAGQQSSAMDWVRRTYSDPAYADPEIATALGKVLRNDSHEGVRIRAVETLTSLPAGTTSDETRAALIEALKSDPNPAVRIKAVEALANLARSGAALDAEAVDTLRQKASQDDENLYVRVKAAEALSSMQPQTP